MYNTRRSNAASNQQMNAPQRPPMNNFVAGGQLRTQGAMNTMDPRNQPGNMANVQNMQMNRPPPNRMQQPKVKMLGNVNLPQQQNMRPPPPQVAQQQQQQPRQNAPPVPKPPLISNGNPTIAPTPPQVQMDVKQEAVVAKPIVAPTPAPSVEAAAASEDLKMDTDAGGLKKKLPSWRTKPKGKISRHDKIRKRNNRLRKILQPKNASMVLNELVGGNLATQVEEANPLFTVDKPFKASISYDNVNHEGYGKSKAQAKSAAAETVIRYIFLKRMKKNVPPINANQSQEPGVAATAAAAAIAMSTVDGADSEGDVKMEEVDDEEDEQMLFSWSHIASLALHKLLTTWDEGGSIINMINGNAEKQQQQQVASVAEKSDVRPAKKLPENAPGMNPIMLIYQMRPNTSFQEVAEVGTPPNILFHIKCAVDGQEFVGIGSSKKAARKSAAYKACKAVLQISYSPEIEVEIAASIMN